MDRMSHTVSSQPRHERAESTHRACSARWRPPRPRAAPLRAQAPAAAAAGALKVMTFNIRYGTANDGENHWDKRKDFLVDVIRAEAPHVLGVQEALHGQLAYILEALPDYAMVGVGRDDGIRKGEYSSILYRRASLSLSRSDTFWFSETPERVASTSWGNTITRICTWAQFTAPDGRPLYVYNLHLDHQSQPSREKSAALLRARIEARDPKAPVIVTGDFNAGEKNPAVMAMLDGNVLRDTFRVAAPGRVAGGHVHRLQVRPGAGREDRLHLRHAGVGGGRRGDRPHGARRPLSVGPFPGDGDAAIGM